MSLVDKIKETPKWIWIVGGGIFIGLILLSKASGGSTTLPGLGQTSDLTDAIAGLQDAINNGGDGTSTNPPPGGTTPPPVTTPPIVPTPPTGLGFIPPHTLPDGTKVMPWGGRGGPVSTVPRSGGFTSGFSGGRKPTGMVTPGSRPTPIVNAFGFTQPSPIVSPVVTSGRVAGMVDPKNIAPPGFVNRVKSGFRR